MALSKRSKQTARDDPGIGIVTASALVSSVTEPNAFKSERHFAAGLGLVLKQNSSGGKTRLGRIAKGDRCLADQFMGWS
ncbi:MAG: IS110 family transposase [Sphingomonadales bacterium]|nr:IS110 family transposase [Sphingomonadales bacterium]MDE2567998.1 IS110 family transposase [Sphingomonadales bacterium]